VACLLQQRTGKALSQHLEIHSLPAEKQASHQQILAGRHENKKYVTMQKWLQMLKV